jgi:cytochrome P450
MLDDMLDPARRALTWFVVHFPAFTKWLYTRTGVLERVVAPILPMKKPATYTRIRVHALKAMESFRDAVNAGTVTPDPKKTVIERLWPHHESVKKGGLDDLEVASECSDHFLAGIDTTSDTLMFLIWALSLPSNHKYQSRLIEEVSNIPSTSLNKFGNPTVEAGDKLPYLDAVVKETLRLYAPIPESEPREPPEDTVIDGYAIPARTIVSLQPYALHRNEEVFPEPLKFNPDRWIDCSDQQLTEMKRWWWAFSSGGRMCIGMHLAMAEMVALVPALYRRYRTSIKPGFEGKAPGIVSRFEVFSDEMFEHTEEHTCWIRFEKQEG